MHTTQSQEVVARFYEAVQYLIDTGQLRSLRAFTEKYGILYSNFYKAMADHSRQVFQIGWMAPLVVDFNISADWLVTGRGSMVFRSPLKSAKRSSPEPEVGEAKK